MSTTFHKAFDMTPILAKPSRPSSIWASTAS